MKTTLPEQFRLTKEQATKRGMHPALASDESFGPNGVFLLVHQTAVLRCIVGVGFGWEHVSVSLSHRIPTWVEMCYVKDTFWDPEETVLQFHPPKSQYVNCHPFCLHLWKQLDFLQPLPPPQLVGPRSP